MTRRLALLFAFALAALTAACAARTSTFDGSVPIRAASTLPSAPACTEHVVAGDSANGSTVCVVRGSDVTVLLQAATGRGWSTPHATGDALGQPRPVPTPAGFVGWSFQAVAAGTADVTASRPVCPSPASGALRCHGVLVYLLHVIVE
jgi:hypothetical protein